MRVRWRNFFKGLFYGGSREAVPEGFARRMTGFSLAGDYLRLRYRNEGRVTTEAQPVHSIFRTGDRVFYGAGKGYGTSVPGNPGGAPIVGTAIYTHSNNVLLGTQGSITRRLTFFSGRSVAGKGTQDEFIYVAGGGQLFKHKKNANTFSQMSRWGIPAPATAITGYQRDFIANVNYIYPLNFNDNLRWTFSNLSGSASFVNDSLDGPGNMCMSLEVGTDTTAKAFKTFEQVKDFTQFSSGNPMSPQDWFVIDIKVTNLKSLDTIELKFFNDPSGQGDTTSEATNLSALSVTLVADDALTSTTTTGANGLGDIPEISDDEGAFVANPPSPASGTSASISERLGSMRLGGEGQWRRLRIPRSAFAYSNPTAAGLTNGWKTITAFEIIITTNKEEDNVTVRFNNGGFVGGVGMQGKYKYVYTLKDPETTHRSNPSPVAEVDAPFRTGTALNLPAAPLTDIEKGLNTNAPTGLFLHTGQGLIREIWRTFGNGAQFFKCGEIPNTAQGNAVSLVYDRVADWRGAHDIDVPPGGASLAGTWILTGVLGTETLPLDNIAPPHGCMDTFGLAYGRVFWTRDETPDTSGSVVNFPGRGRLYYSAPGRLEAVAGFINVTQGGDDAVQKGVIWNGIYVFSQKRCFEILGADEPFVAREILGVPGTLWPYTVVPSPYGIIYEALDGIRVFDGSSSQLLPLTPVEPFFRRDTNARAQVNVSAFVTDVNHVACFVNDEYRWSDGTTYLGFNLRTGAWRNIGAPVPVGLHTESTFGECYGGTTGLISSLEFGSIGGDYTTSTTDSAFSYEFETPGFLVDGRATFYVQRVYVDAVVPSGDSMTVALVIGDGAPASGPTTISLGSISGDGVRTLHEFACPCAYIGVAGVRLTGSSKSGVLRIHGVEADVHVPEAPGDGT